MTEQVQGADAPTIADSADAQVADQSQEQNQEQQKAEPEWTPPTREEYEKLQRKAEKRERIIGKTQAQLRAERQSYQKQQAELAARLERIENAGKEMQEPNPNDSKYNSYDEYVRDLNKWQFQQLQKESTAQKPKQEESFQNPEQAQWAQERSAYQAQKSAELAKQITDWQEVFAENNDLMDELPENLALTFLGIEDGGLAAYTLAKEGRLESLFRMPEQLAVNEIYQAQARGKAFLQKLKKPTNAPAPISQPNRGTAPSGKTPDDMSPEELMDWVAKR